MNKSLRYPMKEFGNDFFDVDEPVLETFVVETGISV
jgi:hypothetical protein